MKIIFFISILLLAACAHKKERVYKEFRYPASVTKSSLQECEDLSVEVGMLDDLFFDHKISNEERMLKRVPLVEQYEDLSCGASGTLPEYNLARACAEIQDTVKKADDLYFHHKITDEQRVQKREPLFYEYKRLGCDK